MLVVVHLRADTRQRGGRAQHTRDHQQEQHRVLHQRGHGFRELHLLASRGRVDHGLLAQEEAGEDQRDAHDDVDHVGDLVGARIVAQEQDDRHRDGGQHDVDDRSTGRTPRIEHHALLAVRGDRIHQRGLRGIHQHECQLEADVGDVRVHDLARAREVEVGERQDRQQHQERQTPQQPRTATAPLAARAIDDAAQYGCDHRVDHTDHEHQRAHHHRGQTHGVGVEHTQERTDHVKAERRAHLGRHITDTRQILRRQATGSSSHTISFDNRTASSTDDTPLR